MNPDLFMKVYASGEALAAAQIHHRWLGCHVTPMRLPRLLGAGRRYLIFEFIGGRPARPEDLAFLAAHLGDAHGAAWQAELHRATLDRPYRIDDQHELAGFVAPRLTALKRRGSEDDVSMRTLLESVAAGPAAFYKDSNPRNILITPTGEPVAVDFDDLTLAPFAYDLAKLVVTLAMTHGPISLPAIEQALTAYNRAAARHAGHLGSTSIEQLLGFAELHHIFTAPYLGRGGYRHLWPDVRLLPSRGFR
jgi:Ser/Thr protein kinase RdoA (MazF antagonist)